MKRRLRPLLGALLALSITVPTGATTALARTSGFSAGSIQQQGAPLRNGPEGTAAPDDSASPSAPRGAVLDSRQVTVTDEASLLAAITDSPNGQETTIKLAGDIALTGTVTIPAGKIITLTHGDGATPTITRATGSSPTTFFSVDPGATFALDGDVTMDGAGSTTCFVDTQGAFEMRGGTLTGAHTTGSSTAGGGAVTVRGGSATFTMTGGTITGTTAVSSYSAAVYIRDGATATMGGGTVTDTTIANQLAGSVVIHDAAFTMNDGTISNGNAGDQIQTSGGVLVLGLRMSGASASNAADSTFTMNGGTIENCSSPRGGGVFLYGGSPTYIDFWSKAHFTMNGGTITGCKATGVIVAGSGTFSAGGGGGVFVENGSDFTMNGGTITSNTSTGTGGGIATFDNFTNFFGKTAYENATGQYHDIVYSDWPSFYPASFTMNGGSLSNNTAQAHEESGTDNGCGGGLYVASSQARINAGTINGNTASKQGGGLYVGSVPYTLTINDSLITGNSASVIGGGVWFCPTGEASINVNSGTALYGNAATGAGDDVSIVRLPTSQTDSTLADRMLGGGLADWHRDGATTNTDDVLGTPDPAVARYSADTAADTAVSGIANDPAPYELKATPSEEAIALSSGLATVSITNNSSTRGGGIGSNGKVVLGNDHEYTESLTVTKHWEAGPSQAAVPDSATVWLTIGGHRVESAVLDASNDWTHTFEGLPLNSGATIEEDVPDGWTADYQASNNPDTRVTSVVVTNRPVEVTPTPTPEATPTPTPEVTPTPTPSTPTGPAPQAPDTPQTPAPTPEGAPSGPVTRPGLPRTGADTLVGIGAAAGLAAAAGGALAARRRRNR